MVLLLSYKLATQLLKKWGLTETQLSLPITDIKMMHSMTDLPRNQCAPCGKSLKNPFFHYVRWECDFAMSSVEKDSLNLEVFCTNFAACRFLISHQWLDRSKKPCRFKLWWKSEVLDPQTRQPLIEELFSTIYEGKTTLNQNMKDKSQR